MALGWPCSRISGKHTPRPDTALPYEPHTAWDALPSGDEVGVVSGGVDRASLDPRTRRLLEAPIVPTLLRLGAPNVLIMLAQGERTKPWEAIFHGRWLQLG